MKLDLEDIGRERVVRASTMWNRVATFLLWLLVTFFALVFLPGMLVGTRLEPIGWIIPVITLMVAFWALGVSVQFFRLWRMGMPVRVAWALGPRWTAHCEDAGLYMVQHKKDYQRHVYPRLRGLTVVPAGIEGDILTPGAGLPADTILAKAPALGAGLGYPVEVAGDPMAPSVVRVLIRVRDPLAGVRHA